MLLSLILTITTVNAWPRCLVADQTWIALEWCHNLLFIYLDGVFYVSFVRVWPIFIRQISSTMVT